MLVGQVLLVPHCSPSFFFFFLPLFEDKSSPHALQEDTGKQIRKTSSPVCYDSKQVSNAGLRLVLEQVGPRPAELAASSPGPLRLYGSLWL